MVRGQAGGIPESQIQALNALVHGQRRKAKELYQRRWRSHGGKVSATRSPPSPAVVDALVGDCEAARKDK